jgi:hypothetical protein
MEFIEATPFSSRLSDYLSDESYRNLQHTLTQDPETGQVIPGTGGFRKMRWPDERRGKGKRGGLRVIYFYFEEDGQLWLLTMYGKDEASDLTNEQKRALQQAITREKAARKAKRGHKSGGR